MGDPRRVIELSEYRKKELERDGISDTDGHAIWSRFNKYVEIEFPTPKTQGRWQLVPGGWVGYIPVSDELHLKIDPKVPLANIFAMWEYAYRVDSKFLDADAFQAATVNDFFENLAKILASKVADRTRRGLYRAYVRRDENLVFLRGRLDIQERLRRPWRTRLPCSYQDHTADIEDNQILLWTLRSILRRGIQRDDVRRRVRRSFQGLRHTADLRHFSGEACARRLYHRLNGDYRPMHALCRFFLDNTGPTHDAGESEMIPFLMDMATLFERFAAEWLSANLPERYEIRAQDNMRFGAAGDIEFKIDMVLFDRELGRAVAVIDTKYKVPDKVATDDVHQVVSYAEAKGCSEAILLYPRKPSRDPDARVGEVRVRALGFDLGGCLDTAGQRLMSEML